MYGEKKQTIILLVLYFLQFYLNSSWGKEYFAKLTNSQEPEPVFFGPLEPEPEPLENTKTYQEPEPLGKKSGAGAAKKLASSQALLEIDAHGATAFVQ